MKLSLFLAFAVGPLFLSPQSARSIDLISSYPDGSQSSSEDSSAPSISADGRLVVFSSAEPFAGLDTNGETQVYLKNRVTGEVSLVSVAMDGSPGNENSFSPQISGDGNFVIFSSFASDLVENDLNLRGDVFVRDLENGSITRVSVDQDGKELLGSSSSGSISANGDILAFDTSDSTLADDNNSETDVYARARMDPSTLRLMSMTPEGTTGNDNSDNPVVSASGEYIVFSSEAGDLVDAETASGEVYRYRFEERVLDWISVNDNGERSNGVARSVSISADGDVVVFSSTATDLTEGGTEEGGFQAFARLIEPDGEGETILISKNSEGAEANGQSTPGVPGISDDGRFIVFKSTATNLGGPAPVGSFQNLYRHNRLTGETIPVVVTSDGSGVGGSINPFAISGNGETIVFQTGAQNILDADLNGSSSDIFAWPDLPKPPAPVLSTVIDNSAARAALLKKMRKFKKKMKSAKRKKQVAKVKRFKKKIKKLKVQLRRL